VLTCAGWSSFEETQGWQEIVATVKQRMALVNLNLLSPETCNSEEKRIRFQTEYMTCLWFINLPKYDSVGGKDETTSPDLSDLPVASK
jgi:hypothetical protein